MSFLFEDQPMADEPNQKVDKMEESRYDGDRKQQLQMQKQNHELECLKQMTDNIWRRFICSLERFEAAFDKIPLEKATEVGKDMDFHPNPLNPHEIESRTLKAEVFNQIVLFGESLDPIRETEKERYCKDLLAWEAGRKMLEWSETDELVLIALSVLNKERGVKEKIMGFFGLGLPKIPKKELLNIFVKIQRGLHSTDQLQQEFESGSKHFVPSSHNRGSYEEGWQRLQHRSESLA